MIVCIIVGYLLFKVISSLNASYFSLVSETTFPVTHWLMMASHGTGEHDSEDFRYTEQFETKEEKKETTVRKMIDNYKEYSPSGLISFLYDKFMITWSYGDGEDILDKVSQDQKNTGLYSWVLGDRSELFRLYCYSFRLSTLFFIVAGLWNFLLKKIWDTYQFIFSLTLFGGVIFYSFWEVKGSYAAPFVYIMLLIGMYGAEMLAGYCDPSMNKKSVKQSAAIPSALLSALAVICILSYNGMVSTEITRREYAVHCLGNLSSQNIVVNTDKAVICQEFYSSRPINRIVLRGWADKDAQESNKRYKMTVSEIEGNEVFSGEICAEDIRENGFIPVNVGDIVPTGRQKYILKLSAQGQKGEMYVQQRTSSYIDTYDGILTVNGKERVNDLHLQVLRKYQSPWCSRKAGLIINAGIFLTIFFSCSGMFNGGFCKNKREYGTGESEGRML